MDRNELLSLSRAEFLRSFDESVERSLPVSVEALFKKADRSASSVEQRRYLDARTLLRNQIAEFRRHMNKSMEKLLNRSFQTTYSTYRPAFPATLQDASISLVDTSAFEDELRFNGITDRFRNEAEEQLRDLNIRVALLFEQDNIKERENPFRPYLFSRAIANSVESLGNSADVNTVLIEQLAENLADCVSGIYEVVNAHLAKQGIAGQLPVKISRSKAPPTAASAGQQRREGEADNLPEQAYSAVAWNSGQGNQFDIDKREVSTDLPRSPVERLLQSVKAAASNLYRYPSGAGAATAGGEYGNEPDRFGGAQGPASGGRSNGSGFAGNGPGGGTTGNGAGGGFNDSTGNGPNAGPGAGSGTRPGTASQSDGAAGNSDGGSTKGGWLSGKQMVGEVLRNFFSGSGLPAEMGGQDGGGTTAEAGNARPGVSQLASSVQSLLRQSTPRTEEMIDSSGQVRNLVMERRSALNEAASGVQEQMTIDIVAMLFEFILRDTQIPAEVRAQIGRLQFLVLKVALRDNSLLTQKAHPARMLINRIGSISIGLKQIDPSGANVTNEIIRIVATLLDDETENPILFSDMLDELDAFIARELLSNDKSVSSAVEAVEQAESRTLRFAHTMAQMHEALSGLTIDSHLRDFFEKDWVRAVELADRTDSEQAKKYRLMVPDLLWSILPKIIEEDRQMLLMLLPIILQTLQAGMKSVHWDPEDKRILMDWLLDTHTVVLRGAHDMENPITLATVHEHFKKFVENSEMAHVSKRVNETLSENRKFFEKSIQELDQRIQVVDDLFDQDQGQADEEENAQAPTDPIEEPAMSVTERLRIGVAIEINLGNKPANGRLHWINPNALNLLLTLEDHSEPAVISVRMFQRLLAKGRIRFLESEPIFERAVRSLLTSANQVA
jgi:hypothetical protein